MKIIHEKLKKMLFYQRNKKNIKNTNNGKNVPSLEVVEVNLIQCNLGYNQYQQKCEVLYNFTPNKSDAHLNVDSNSLVLLKTFAYLNGRP